MAQSSSRPALMVAENVALQLERRVSLRRAMKRAIKIATDMGVEGIKIRVSGRLGGAELAATAGRPKAALPAPLEPPAAAELAKLPKGSVTVSVSNWTADRVQVYVAGAPELKSVAGDGEMTFDDVADFGPGVLQPSIGIWGLYRFTSYPPYADVQPGQTVPGGNLIIQSPGFSGFGAGKVSWKAGGSALAYGMRSASAISQIPANPPYGSTGVDLPVVEQASPSLVAWGPTPATKDQYLYSSGMSVFKANVGGIYLNTVGDASGGTQVVLFYDYSAENVHDIEWLPDGSGFLFSMRWVPLDICSDIFEYTFSPPSITQLTNSLWDESSDGGARGLGVAELGVQQRGVGPRVPPAHPGVGEAAMHRPERGDRLGEARLDLLLVAHVALQRQRLAALHVGADQEVVEADSHAAAVFEPGPGMAQVIVVTVGQAVP